MKSCTSQFGNAGKQGCRSKQEENRSEKKRGILVLLRKDSCPCPPDSSTCSIGFKSRAFLERRTRFAAWHLKASRDCARSQQGTSRLVVASPFCRGRALHHGGAPTSASPMNWVLFETVSWGRGRIASMSSSWFHAQACTSRSRIQHPLKLEDRASYFLACGG